MYAAMCTDMCTDTFVDKSIHGDMLLYKARGELASLPTPPAFGCVVCACLRVRARVAKQNIAVITYSYNIVVITK